MLATKSNARAMVKLLVKHGADMEISHNDGETALLCAAEEGYMEIVNTLLSCGAKVDPDVLRENMLAIAVARGDIEAVRMYINLLANNAAIRQYWHILQGSQLQELSEATETVLSLAVNLPELKSIRGSTLLHWAARLGTQHWLGCCLNAVSRSCLLTRTSGHHGILLQEEGTQRYARCL
jgi:ankyrin repeat protein